MVGNPSPLTGNKGYVSGTKK